MNRTSKFDQAGSPVHPPIEGGKAGLAQRINRVLDTRELTQAAAAELLTALDRAEIVIKPSISETPTRIAVDP